MIYLVGKVLILKYLRFPVFHVIRQNPLLQVFYLNNLFHAGAEGMEQLKEYYPQTVHVTLQSQSQIEFKFRRGKGLYKTYLVVIGQSVGLLW